MVLVANTSLLWWKARKHDTRWCVIISCCYHLLPECLLLKVSAYSHYKSISWGHRMLTLQFLSGQPTASWITIKSWMKWSSWRVSKTYWLQAEKRNISIKPLSLGKPLGFSPIFPFRTAILAIHNKRMLWQKLPASFSPNCIEIVSCWCFCFDCHFTPKSRSPCLHPFSLQNMFPSSVSLGCLRSSRTVLPLCESGKGL